MILSKKWIIKAYCSQTPEDRFSHVKAHIHSRYLFIEFGFYNCQTKQKKKKQMIICTDCDSFLSNKNKTIIHETIYRVIMK